MGLLKKALILLICIDNSIAQEDVIVPFDVNTPEQLYHVSIYQIAANPQKFVSKPVYITGYVSMKPHLAIYADKNSCLDAFVINAITFQGVKDSSKKLSEESEHCEILSVFGKIGYAFSYKNGSANLYFRIAHFEGLVDLYEY